jgi:hypothetical protein
MRRWSVRLHKSIFSWRHLWTEELVCLFLALFIFIAPVSAAMRFQQRSLYMNSTVPGETTSYKVSFRYMSPEVVGSVDMLFCISPIPYEPCVTPPGLDVSNATLTSQTGETGFTIGTQTTNHMVLTRTPTMVTATEPSSYTFDGIQNPTNTDQSFSIRLRSHGTINATGAQIDFGSVKGQVTDGIVIETQVPPMLIFCAAQQVEENCTSTNDTFYTDMGELDDDSTLVAQSQMAVGTNASSGFVITANGGPPAAGTNVIEPLSTPTESSPGANQFGINLVANSTPTVGSDPVGMWTNAVPATDYNQPNRYKYEPGDVVAYSPNVSLMKKFTVSYIINSSKNLRGGVYTTTITYVASGRF